MNYGRVFPLVSMGFGVPEQEAEDLLLSIDHWMGGVTLPNAGSSDSQSFCYHVLLLFMSRDLTVLDTGRTDSERQALLPKACH